MRFRDVVIKNFIGNIKEYLGLFLCSWFSIALFFSYTTLIFNDAISSGDNKWINYVLPVTMISISLFSIFFIIYANTSFVKSRNKEFGVYLTLGMSHKELKNIIKVENLIIFAVSLIMGIITGALFSRLFQMVILNIIEIDNINFFLDYKSFLVTMASFILIFIVVFIINNRYMNRMDINSLLVESRKSEGKEEIKSIDIILATIGVILLIISGIAVIVIAKSETLNSNLVVIFGFIICLYGSIYLVISRIGTLIISRLKKTKYYIYNLLSISEMNHKYKQNKRVMFILSILSSVIIMLLASPFSLFNLSEEVAEQSKNNLEFVQTSDINYVNEDKLNEIINEEKVKDYTKIDFVFLNKKDGMMPVIKESDYVQQTGINLGLNDNECAVFIVDWTPGDHGYTVNSDLNLSMKENNYNYKITKATHNDIFVGSSFPSDAVTVLKDDEFNKLSNELPKSNIGKYHMINYENWKNIQGIEDTLKAEFKDSSYPLFSILAQYKDVKAGYASFLFVSSVLGILFFIAGGMVLYFRQFIEINNTKKLFDKLYKIGITKKEIKQTVSKELKLVFFVPFVFGVFAGTAFIYLITHMVGGENILSEFMQNTLIVIIVYFVLQLCFYLITKFKYVKEILK